MKIVSFEYQPFVVLNNSKTGIDRFSGFEAKLLKKLAEKMNFRLEVELLNKSAWGKVLANGRSYGAVKRVINRKANLTAGFFIFCPERNKVMTPSLSYYSTNLVWIATPGKIISSFKRFQLPFEPEVWYSVIAFLIIGFAVIAMIERSSLIVRNFVFGQHVKLPMLEMFNVLLGGAMARLPGRDFARTMLAFYLIYSLLIRNAYSGALYRFMQTDRRHQRVNTMQDMLDQNYTFLVLDEMRSYVSHSTEILKRTKIMDKNEYEVAKFQLLSGNKKLAMLTSVDQVAYWNKNLEGNHEGHHEFNILEKTKFPVSLVFYLHKQSCLTFELSRNILGLIANGFIADLEQHYKKPFHLKKYNAHHEPRKLEMWHLLGAICFLKYGLVLSTICFILEVLYKKLRDRKLSKKLLKRLKRRNAIRRLKITQ